VRDVATVNVYQLVLKFVVADVNTDRLAAVWPTIGIIIEIIVLVIFIAICEVRSRRKAAAEDAKCK